jgi:hypothetical protein
MTRLGAAVDGDRYFCAEGISQQKGRNIHDILISRRET